MVWIFYRKDDQGKVFFYAITVTDRCKPDDHARLNPGTLKIEDAATGKILWQKETV